MPVLFIVKTNIFRGGMPNILAKVHALPQVLAALSVLISSAGMSKVQSVIESCPGSFHPMLENTIESAFEWGTDGCEF